MATFGLQVYDSGGNLTFDSNFAIGGVCLGFFTIATGGQTITFPEYVTETGFGITNKGVPIWVATIDNVPGYLRFVFPSVCAGSTYALFAK